MNTELSKAEAETTFIFQVELKDLGIVSKSLGILFQYDDATGWSLDQEQVIKELLEKFQLDKVAPVHVSIGGDHDGEGTGDLLPNGGAGAPGVWSNQTSHAPREGDWCLAKNIAKYLKGAVHYKFAINGDKAGVLVEAYSDAEYAADKTDRTSVTGGIVVHVGLALPRSRPFDREQRSAPLVAASTTEQEIQRVCTGATSDGAALEDCGAALPGLVALAYPVQAEANGVGEELEPLQHSVPDARESSGARANGDSAQDDEEVAQEKYGKELVKSLGGNLGGDLKKVILPDMRGDVACFNAPHPHECEDCCRRGSDIQGRRRPDEHG
ncbi:hypothetical protein PI126_g4969 [Phytophthora idaei]|nr:hypothetical protein PI126_g4969 [Phytophthora idaei]